MVEGERALTTVSLVALRHRDYGLSRWMLVSYGAYSASRAEKQRPLSSLVEHFLGKEEVVGPIPTGGSVIRFPGAVAG